VLYHWRIYPGARTFSSRNRARATAAARRALAEQLAASGEAVEIVQANIAEWHRVVRKLASPAPSVSLIVPTRDQLALLRACAEGILRRTRYPSLELVIVDNGSLKPATADYLRAVAADPRVRVLRDERPFNFSALNNAAARVARGEILGFVNNDVEAIEPGWLEELVTQLGVPDVAAVGAKLLYGNGAVQHAGVALGIGGVAGHPGKGLHRSDPGYFGDLQIARSVSAVTAACMLVKRAAFEAVGGFDEADLAVAFNDVDLCLKLRRAGWRIVWTPYAELYHHESASRGSDAVLLSRRQRFLKEHAVMRRRWRNALDRDPYFNPNLSLATERLAIAFPPRVRPPWHGRGAAEDRRPEG
jgi:GT2 family glycosyltransferase